MRTPRPFVPALIALLLARPVYPADLMDIYERARQSDPTLREAEANLRAVEAGQPLARGALLPQLTGSASWTEGRPDDGNSRTFSQVRDADNDPTTTDDRRIFTTTSISEDAESTDKRWAVQLRQTVFRWDQWVRLNQANKQAAQAEVDYQAAQQDLMLRVSDAYFNVLAAEDALLSEQATKEAIGRQLEQAQKRFEVGLIAITDVQEAQAAYDQAVAAEILARRNLANTKEALRAIIDEYPPELAKPTQDLPLQNPAPADENRWVDMAMEQNLALISSRMAAQIAKDDVRIARSGHLPTLDLVAQRSDVDIESEQFTRVPPGPVEGPFPGGQDTLDDSIGLQLEIPIYSGGRTSAQVEQAVFRHRAARERLEATARETERQTRDAYLGVITEISRVQALRQALESARTALKATEAGYEVGTRTTVDVLDARRQVFIAETNFLRSRYDYLLNGLRLQQAAGNLAPADLAEISSLLVMPSSPEAPPAPGTQTAPSSPSSPPGAPPGPATPIPDPRQTPAPTPVPTGPGT